MENITMNKVAMASLLNETLLALASPTVHGTSTIIRVLILSVLGICLALLILLCCCHCLKFEIRPQVANAMGSIFLLMMLLAVLIALIGGAVKLIICLFHSCGPLHIPVWLVDFWDSATTWVIHAWNSIGMPILFVLGLTLALLVLLSIGFMVYGIAPGFYASMWMSSIGNVIVDSLISHLQEIAMGGIYVLKMLLYIVPCVALVVGAFEIIVWLVHAGAIRDSALSWMLHAQESNEMPEWWHCFVAWLHNLWVNITDHHKWKIYT